METRCSVYLPTMIAESSKSHGAWLGTRLEEG